GHPRARGPGGAGGADPHERGNLQASYPPPEFSTDFRSAKSTHIPPDKPQCFSRTIDIVCEVIFCPIGLLVNALLRGHHLFIASRGAPELPGRHVQWLSAMAQGVAPQLTVVTNTSARSGVAESEKDVHAASVVPSETTAHETTAVRASSS